MKVGDYVRTKDGIERIKDIKEWVNFQGYEKIITTDKNQYETLYEQSEIIKSSPNIIDLIEVGDYVNGIKVDFTNIDNKLTYEDTCIGFYDYDGDGDITLFANDIKSIVTKKQFKSMEYKVGE